MTTPDSPPAEVTVGPSEIASALVIVGALLTDLFGHDWGIGTNAQRWALPAAAVVAAAQALARAWKHHSATQANAAVAVAQAQQQALNPAPMPPTDLAPLQPRSWGVPGRGQTAASQRVDPQAP